MTPKKRRADGPKVVVAGGGLAGMTAALALAKRNCQVSLYEEKDMLGGNVASRHIGQHAGKDVYVDVYPHMYQPWYHNFWRLMEEVGIDPESDPQQHPDARFVPFRRFFQLRKDEFPNFTYLEDAYSASHLGDNLLSGVGSPGDMLVFGYAGLDLVAERLNPTVRLPNMSMSGFLNARTYMTRGALNAYETFITRVWAIPGYLASAEDCRTYLTFCFPTGDKPSRLTRGPAIEAYIARLRDKLENDWGVKVFTKKRIEKVVCAPGRVSRIFVQDTKFQRKTETWVGTGKATPLEGSFDYLILAVPPTTLLDLTRDGAQGARIVDQEPCLAMLSRLGAQAVPILHLCLNVKLQGIPEGPVGLFGSELNLAFTDISQSWRGANPLYEKKTVLAVSCSEPTKLVGPPLADGQKIIKELADYLGFDSGPDWGVSADVDWSMTRYHGNADAKLSLNAIGTEEARPGARCEQIPNLFIAGDFCQHYVGMTTVEAAVVGGLAAARDLAEQVSPPLEQIEVLKPETWPDELYVAARYAWAPAIVAAKTWAMAGGEWAEAMPPVDVGGGEFGARLTGGVGEPRPYDEPRPRENESLLSYLLTPGLPPRRRQRGPRDYGRSAS